MPVQVYNSGNQGDGSPPPAKRPSPMNFKYDSAESLVNTNSLDNVMRAKIDELNRIKNQKLVRKARKEKVLKKLGLLKVKKPKKSLKTSISAKKPKPSVILKKIASAEKKFFLFLKLMTLKGEKLGVLFFKPVKYSFIKGAQAYEKISTFLESHIHQLSIFFKRVKDYTTSQKKIIIKQINKVTEILKKKVLDPILKPIQEWTSKNIELVKTFILQASQWIANTAVACAKSPLVKGIKKTIAKTLGKSQKFGQFLKKKVQKLVSKGKKGIQKLQKLISIISGFLFPILLKIFAKLKKFFNNIFQQIFVAAKWLKRVLSKLPVFIKKKFHRLFKAIFQFFKSIGNVTLSIDKKIRN